MSTDFTSRTGLRPFVTKRAPGKARVHTKADVAEFEALMRIMQEAHFDALGKFYGGAKLTYDKSVTQKILVAAVREVGDKLGAGVKNPQSPGANWVLERAKGLARLVMKHESAYLIDNVGAALYDKAASAIQDQLQEVVLKGVPVVGLLKTGWDALATSGDALDKLVRTGIAHRHTRSNSRRGSLVRRRTRCRSCWRARPACSRCRVPRRLLRSPSEWRRRPAASAPRWAPPNWRRPRCRR
jgi:hypothetical protein